MRLLGTLAFFLLGAVAGAVAGALLATLITPQSGDELRVKLRERIDEGRQARARAEAETAEILTQRFRTKVGDPDALADA